MLSKYSKYTYDMQWISLYSGYLLKGILKTLQLFLSNYKRHKLIKFALWISYFLFVWIHIKYT